VSERKLQKALPVWVASAEQVGISNNNQKFFGTGYRNIHPESSN
jgi:hypothetical protein